MWIDRYYNQAQKLLPQGLIWRVIPGGPLEAILWMAAGQLSDCHGRAENLINEAIPQSARELLTEWETFAGLPDECTVGEANTVPERQNAVVEKLTGQGTLSVQSFYDLAARLGYEIQIVEYRPFTTGRSRCGGSDVLGDHRARYYWRVTIIGDRVHLFRCGRNTAGERLGWYSPARDLECFLNRRKPAHTIPIYDYQEAICDTSPPADKPETHLTSTLTLALVWTARLSRLRQ